MGEPPGCWTGSTSRSSTGRPGSVGWLGANLGSALRQAQSGQLQGYGAAISVGIVFIVGLYIFFL